jgi:cytochrome d ubiquinol oxidase subunit II
MTLDLPFIWAGVIAVAVCLYVLLDGFDLGVGMLFPFARDRGDRDVMMNTIAPVWDGNETWLVLGGGGLLAAFPIAYSVLMPALYMPVMTMLAGLILRGVAFEFRGRGRARGRPFWTAAFAGGSVLATLAQGFVLGGFIQGIKIKTLDGIPQFAGGPFDWLTPYTVLIALGLAAGYALLGAAWLMMKTQDELHGDARRWTGRAAMVVAVFLAAVSLATLAVHPLVAARWGVGLSGIDLVRLAKLSPIPLLGVAGLCIATVGVRSRSHGWPFVGVVLVFLSGYLGLAVGLAPYVVPYDLTFRQAAAADNALGLMLVGVAVLLPLILAYTAFVYWTFRGKVTPDAGYH